MNVLVPLVAFLVGVGAGVGIDLLALHGDNTPAPHPAVPAPVDIPLRDRVLLEAASRSLGQPPSGSAPAPFGPFDVVAFPPQDRFDHQKTLASAAALVDEALAQGIRTIARPLVVIRGFDPGSAPPPAAITSQVVLPVPRAFDVRPPLVAGRLDGSRVALVAVQPIGTLPPEVLSRHAAVLQAAGHVTAPLLLFRFADRAWRTSGEPSVQALIGVREPAR